MKIKGTFYSVGNKYKNEVIIENAAIEAADIIIGDNDDSDIFFGTTPVIIHTQRESSFTHIITHQATINIVSKIWLGDYLFADKSTSITVKIKRGGYTIFAGYLEHNTFSQDYMNKWNELSINAIDYLQALEFEKITDVLHVGYDELKENSDIQTFGSLLRKILKTEETGVSIYYDGSKRINSQKAKITEYLSISDNAWLGDDEDDMMNNSQILESILKYLNLHIVQMIDIRAVGNLRDKDYSFYLFDNDWMLNETNGSSFYIYDLNDTTTQSAISGTFPRMTKDLIADDFAGDDTNISIDDVFTKITVSEEGQEFDNIISNPLDTNTLESDFPEYNRYMTEFVTLGDGNGSKNKMINMVKLGQRDSETYDESSGFFRHWYVQYLYNSQWEFKSYQVTPNEGSPTTGWQPIRQSTSLYKDATTSTPPPMYDTATAINTKSDQWAMIKAAWYRGYNLYDYETTPGDSSTKIQVPITGDPIESNYAAVRHPLLGRRGNCIGATMFNIWSSGKITPNDNTAGYKKENSQNWLVITTNNIYSDAVQNSMISSGESVCRYMTQNSASFTPISDDYTYYLVFTGKIVLSPFIKDMMDYRRLRYIRSQATSNIRDFTLQSNFNYGNGDHCRYTRLFYDGSTPKTNLGDQYNTNVFKYYGGTSTNIGQAPAGLNENGANLVPWIKDDGLKRFKYTSPDGDKINKVGVLLCRLKIGDKYLCEDLEAKGDFDYATDEFSWHTEAEIQAQNLWGYFTIGFDPKIDDYLIGQEYNIGKPISTFINIDKDYGMAVPIKKSDNLAGKVQFDIIGPCSIGWDDHHHRHRTWFRKAKDWTNLINVFYNMDANRGDNCDKAVENIYIGELKCSLYTDNAGNNFYKENDIIYMSDENNLYMESKDDIDFDFMSGLTEDESIMFGVDNKPLINTVLNENLLPNTTISTRKIYRDADGVIYTKPEKLYVKQYYEEYKKPRILMSTTTKYENDYIQGSRFKIPILFRRYTVDWFNNKTFWPLSREIDLQKNMITWDLKETHDIE